MNIKEQLKSFSGFQQSQDTVFNKQLGFTDIITRSGITMTDDRKRMADYEGIVFGFVGADSVKEIEKLGNVIQTMPNSDLAKIISKRSNGLAYIGETGAYFLAEEQTGNILQLGGFIDDKLGFVSIRKDNSDAQYHLGNTSKVYGELAFQANNGEGIVISKGKTPNDVIPGRIYLRNNHVDLESITINPSNNDGILDIDFKLTGEKRYEPVANSRGINPGETYRKNQKVNGVHFTQSQDNKHFYDIKAMVRGFEK